MRDCLDRFKELGYAKLSNIYNDDEVARMIQVIESNFSNENNTNVFAIRQLLTKVPSLKSLVFNNKLKSFLENYFQGYFITKGIYFDKPPYSNWFVAYHQDLSISVKKRYELEGYKNWTNKKNQLGVQPPLEILQNTITLRIHLDDTDENNGALRVIPKTHLQGVLRYDQRIKDSEVTCTMSKGDVMLMSPLLFHASNKTTNNKRRRVIHLELNNKNLQTPLEWLEKEVLI